MTLSYFVAGIPQPQGSKTAFVVKGRAVIADAGTAKSRKAHKSWRQSVHNATVEALSDEDEWSPLDEAVTVELGFYFPATASDPHRHLHTVTPDLDKLVRLVLDSLVTGKMLKDDARVCNLHAFKHFAQPDDQTGCQIIVTPRGREAVKQKALRQALARSPVRA